MKKSIFNRNLCFILLLFFLYIISFSCKEKKSDIQWVNDGITMISEEVNLDDENYIKSIRILYDNLSEKEKKKINDYQKLVEAEEKIYNLKLQSGKIIELKFSQDISSLSLKYISGDDEIEKKLSENDAIDFISKLSQISGERKNKNGANKEKYVDILIGNTIITCFYESDYFIINDSTFVFIRGNLDFVFTYFDK